MGERGGYGSRVPTTILDERLHQLTIAAVVTGAAWLHVRHSVGQRVPIDELPHVVAFESGWPMFSVTHRSSDPDDRRHRQRIEKPTYLSQFDGFGPDQSFESSPEMLALCAYVTESETLSRRFAPTRPDGSTLDCGAFTRAWVGRLLERAWNKGALPALPPFGKGERRHVGPSALDPDPLRRYTMVVELMMDRRLLDEIYSEAEAAVLARTLETEWWIPLVLTPLAQAEALQLDESCRIEPLTEELQLARAVGGSDILAGSPQALRDAATHALVVRGRPLDNTDLGARLYGTAKRDAARRDAPDFDAIDLACQALRITTGAHVGYAQVWMRPLGWADGWRADLPAMTLHESVRRYDPKLDNYGWLTTTPGTVSNERLAETPQVLKSLKTADLRTRLASRRLSLAVLRDDEDDCTVDLCIGLEALLSDGAGTELTYKISVRGAAALATRAKDPLVAREVKTLLAKIYGHRSAVVHGSIKVAKTRVIETKDDHGKTLSRTPVADVAEELLRALLIDALERGWDAQELDNMIVHSFDSTTSG